MHIISFTKDLSKTDVRKLIFFITSNYVKEFIDSFWFLNQKFRPTIHRIHLLTIDLIIAQFWWLEQKVWFDYNARNDKKSYLVKWNITQFHNMQNLFLSLSLCQKKIFFNIKTDLAYYRARVYIFHAKAR